MRTYKEIVKNYILISATFRANVEILGTIALSADFS